MRAKVRLYVDAPLAQGQPVTLSREQAHYLFGVMRLAEGARIALFNGRDGEWTGEIAEAGKRGGSVVPNVQALPQTLPPDLWLLFAPIKKARTDFIVEKAVELGVRRVLPVLTDFTNSERVRQDRLQAHAIEAAEQCGAVFVPEVAEAERLDKVLAGWNADRALVFCDEAAAGAGPSANADPKPPSAVLIGPEGGFSDPERARLRALPFTSVLSLGPRILRADTAAVAALTLWQSRFGDWQ